MPETRQELLAKLTQARNELAESQTRVAELQALLSESQADPGALRVAEDIRNLAKFPDENPNPLLRVARDGTLLYANPASHRLLAHWGCTVGTQLPEDIQRVISEAV